jgi:hypothetical protein
MINNELSKKLYLSISEANEVRILKNWHCSSMAECPRSHYFKRMGVKTVNVPTAAKMLRWQAGHIIEEVIRPHLLKMYPDLKSNVRLRSKKLDLTGEYDNYSEEVRTIFEIKSVHVFAPKNIEREGKPYLNHEYQNHTYKILLSADDTEVLVDKEKDLWVPLEKPLQVESITYIYIALDGRIIVLDTKVQESIVANIQKRLEILKAAMEGTIPPCLCKETHPLWKSTTQYCDYQEKGKECCRVELLNKKEAV